MDIRGQISRAGIKGQAGDTYQAALLLRLSATTISGAPEGLLPDPSPRPLCRCRGERRYFIFELSLMVAATSKLPLLR